MYRYTLMPVADARAWLGAGGPWASRVGLTVTALYIERAGREGSSVARHHSP